MKKIITIKNDFLVCTLMGLFLTACANISPESPDIAHEPVVERQLPCPEQQNTGHSGQGDPDLDGGISGTGHGLSECKEQNQ